MAAPGEFFPTQFAMGILQLKQSKDQQAAQLAQMRNQAAASNFLEKQKLQFAQDQQAFAEDQASRQNRQNQAQQNFQNQQSVGRDQAAYNNQVAQNQLGWASLAQHQESAKAEQDIQKTAADARVKLEAEKIKQERDQTVERSVAEFGRSGNAFIPTYAAGQVPKLLSQFNAAADSGVTGAYRYTTIDMPGAGTIVQRIGGPGQEKETAQIDAIHANIGRLQSQSALDAKRAEYIGYQEKDKEQRIGLISGKFNLDANRNALQQLEGLRKAAADAAASLRASPNANDRARAREIAADPKQAFTEDSPERRRWNQASIITESWLSDRARNLPTPQTTDVDAIKTAGVGDAIFAEPLGPPTAAPASAAPAPATTAPANKPTVDDLSEYNRQEATYRQVSAALKSGNITEAQKAQGRAAQDFLKRYRQRFGQ